MRVLGLGHLLFAVGLASLGVLSLISGDFAFTWQPVPAWIPWRESLAHAFGLLQLAGGIGMLVKRTAAPCALAMTIYLLSWVILLQTPRVAEAPGNVGAWLGFCENLVLMSGGWILFASLAGPVGRRSIAFVSGNGGTRIARLLIGVSCLVFGLSHFVYPAGTASMVPAWIPAHVGFAYLTGAAHFAAGVGILFAILPRLAATLEAIMISSFVLLIHGPGVVAAPTGRLQWTMLSVALALAGAVWTTAKSLQGSPWISIGGPPRPPPLPNVTE
jgi:uncharacterized membrane protein